MTNLLYSGEQFNPVSGLQYLRARWYNPQSGTFNRLDPFAGDVESPLSFHKYAYAHMNPVNHIDPSGKSILLAGIVAGMLLSMTLYTLYTRPMQNFNIRSASGDNFGDYFAAFDDVYRNTLRTLVEAVSAMELDPCNISRAQGIARQVAKLYANKLMQFRKETLGERYMDLTLVGRAANTYASIHRAQWGCKNLALELKKSFDGRQSYEDYFIFENTRSSFRNHSWVVIRTKDNKYSWATTAWETGLPGLVPTSEYRLQPSWFTDINAVNSRQ